MTRRATITILGSGTSTGVPVVGCDCAVCRDTRPHNKRLRASIMIETDTTRIVVDTGPDFREQMLRAGVKELRHVLYTHTHADHTHGFDDLRAFYFRNRESVVCRIAARYEKEFRQRFAYAFEDTGYEGTLPQVELVPFGDAPFMIDDLEIEPVLLDHGHVQTAAFRIGRFAYATDFKIMPAEVQERWRGQLDLLIATGVHLKMPHKTHLIVPETVALMQKLEVRQGLITHTAHDVDVYRDAAELPRGIAFAFDGQRIEVDL